MRIEISGSIGKELQKRFGIFFMEKSINGKPAHSVIPEKERLEPITYIYQGLDKDGVTFEVTLVEDGRFNEKKYYNMELVKKLKIKEIEGEIFWFKKSQNFQKFPSTDSWEELWENEEKEVTLKLSS